MHKLMVSDEVMDNLRALCLGGGQSEDYVLRRLLGCPPKAAPHANGDFIDATYGVRFAEGFRIFRTYKGRPYSAQVSNGYWVLDGEAVSAGAFNSLNQLSQAVIDGNENAWKFWFYQSPGGEARRIAELRDPALVQRRPRRNRPRAHTKELSRQPATQSMHPPPQSHRPAFQPEIASQPLPPEPGPVAGPATASVSPRKTLSKPWEPA